MAENQGRADQRARSHVSWDGRPTVLRVRTLHPFMAAELGERFDLGRALSHGLLPVVWEAADPAYTLSARAMAAWVCTSEQASSR